MTFEGLLAARVDLSFVERALSAAKDPRTLAAAWRKARKPLRADQRDHAKRKAGSDGSWASRSPLTQRKVGQGHGNAKRPRKLLGKLPGALTASSSTKGVKVESRAKWSRAIQEGGRVGNGARLPAREFLWASATVLGIVADIVAAGIATAFQKGQAG